MKPGLKSTEHWVAVLGAMGAIQQAATDPDWQVKVAALAALGAIVCTYLWSRTRLKEAAGEA